MDKINASFLEEGIQSYMKVVWNAIEKDYRAAPDFAEGAGAVLAVIDESLSGNTSLEVFVRSEMDKIFTKANENLYRVGFW